MLGKQTYWKGFREHRENEMFHKGSIFSIKLSSEKMDLGQILCCYLIVYLITVVDYLATTAVLKKREI